MAKKRKHDFTFDAFCLTSRFDWNVCYFSNMNENSRHQIIKRLQAELPRGAPFDLAVLGRIGVSPLARRALCRSGLAHPSGSGRLCLSRRRFRCSGALSLLQKRVPGLHVGGKGALALQGVRHNLSSREALVLWGDHRFYLPPWFTSRFPARYVHARLFEWPDAGLAGKILLGKLRFLFPCITKRIHIIYMLSQKKPNFKKVINPFFKKIKFLLHPPP